MTYYCHACGRELEGNAFGRMGRCPGCEADTRCCLNCVFHEPSYRSECKETQAEPVRDREASNPCDYFRPKPGPGPARKPKAVKGEGKAAFDALFRRPPQQH